MFNNKKKKLYRKVNTKTYGVWHRYGIDYRFERAKLKNTDITRKSMHSKKQRGLDYTPLFKFLLSKVGSNWSEVYSEAKARLDKDDPIFWMVALHEEDKRDYIRMGKNSYYSGLYVDQDGILQVVNPHIHIENFEKGCHDTITFNGKLMNRVTNRNIWDSEVDFYKPPKDTMHEENI
jgi:hypothetical protein